MTSPRSINDTSRFILIALTLIVSQLAWSKDKLIVGWEHFPPQQFLSKDGELQGIDIDIIRATLEQAGFEIEFKNLPWKRILNASLRNGEVDIALNAALKESRKPYVYYSSIPYLTSDSALFILKKNTDKFNSLQTLSDIASHNFTIGVTRELVYSNEYAKLRQNPDFAAKLYESAKEENIVKMLLTERVDAIILEQFMLNKILPDWKTSSDVKFHSEIDLNVDAAGSFFIFSKASMTQAQVDKINQSLEQLKQAGSLRSMIKRYQ